MVDREFVLLALNSLSYCHGNFECEKHTERLMYTKAMSDSVHFLPDYNLHGSLGFLLGSGPGFLAGNNSNSCIGYGQCVRIYSPDL